MSEQGFFQSITRLALNNSVFAAFRKPGEIGASVIIQKKAELIPVKQVELLSNPGFLFAPFHEHGSYKATMGVWRYFHQIPYGCVYTRDNCVDKMEEKPVIERLVNGGIYVLDPTLVKRVPRKFFHMTELLEEAFAKKETVGFFDIGENWLDVGRPGQLVKARAGI